MISMNYCIDTSFPFIHKVIITFQNDDNWDFSKWCRDTFETMGKQFLINRETFVDSDRKLHTRYILHLESEDMAVLIKLSHG